MDVGEAIRELPRIRKYLDVPVPWELVAGVVDAGRVAQSAGNLETRKFITVREEGTRKLLASASLQQYWMAKAPVHIVICEQLKRMRDHFGIRGERFYSIQDAALSAQNMMLYAHSQGLGTAFVVAFNEEEVSKVLGIPEDVRPQAIITLGYPDEKPVKPPRYTIENVTYFETWAKRVGNMANVLWDWRLSQKAASASEDVAKTLEIKTRGLRARLKEKIREAVKRAQEKAKERAAKKKGKNRK